MPYLDPAEKIARQRERRRIRAELHALDGYAPAPRVSLPRVSRSVSISRRAGDGRTSAPSLHVQAPGLDDYETDGYGVDDDDDGERGRWAVRVSPALAFGALGLLAVAALWAVSRSSTVAQPAEPAMWSGQESGAASSATPRASQAPQRAPAPVQRSQPVTSWPARAPRSTGVSDGYWAAISPTDRGEALAGY